MIKKYRKKPVIIEAIQFKGGNYNDIELFIGGQVHKGVNEIGNVKQIIIETLEGAMTANIDDYIIKGVKGEFYPCKPDIFEATYEDMISESCNSKGFLDNVEMIQVEGESYRYKSGIIHSLMVIYGFSLEEAKKVMYKRDIRDFLLDSLESKATGHMKQFKIENHIHSGVDIEKVAANLEGFLSKENASK
ncbi:hypothetical protein J2S14_003076 [Lederbergia wuyishanensis]|uniref:Phage protein n=1 Tax=Lederbergia wuyishanensis TaxID=1347903 RepID=A0ABU0D789_9BACI|nr:hypothetical protein [Lederbergia wuyishanensis]MDQ0344235.1 hypothetical protein [Lederbergia wuyishanensis]